MSKIFKRSPNSFVATRFLGPIRVNAGDNRINAVTANDHTTGSANIYVLRSWILVLTFGLFGATFAKADFDERTAITVLPTTAQLHGRLARLQIAVSRRTDDDYEDLTRSVAFESLTPQLVRVDATGFVRPLANGTGRIQIRLAQQSQVLSVTVTGIETVSASFLMDVVPVLNRAGCTAGSCHAAQYGQGGLKLSLLGFAPEQDWAPLARERAQRRISLVSPAESLMLQKATHRVAHGGGRRFREGSYEYEVLLEWLRAGAPQPDSSEPNIVDLTITPQTRIYTPGQTQQLRVEATYSDGSMRDVTRGAMYDSMSDAVAEVTANGHITAIGHGQAPVMIRYMGQAKTAMAIVPYAAQVNLAGFESKNFVDDLVRQHWQRLGISPSPVCSDEVFVRRAFLDATGTLPQPERIMAFLSSEQPDKRDALVDELLGLTGDPNRDIHVNEWSAYWALKWGDLIRNNRNKLGDGGMWALYNWTRSSLRENKPIDQFVRELITAQGSVFESGPANYYKITTKPDELAESTAQNFLGIRLQCAKCHHHPYEVYSQADYYGLAAFFTRVATKGSSDFGALGQDTVVLVRRSGSIQHPRTRQTLDPTPLLGEAIDADQHRDLRQPLANWLTSPDNKLFARNIANRFWGYLMGSGLVEPIDDMRATNPPSNPELLDALAQHVVESQFDLRSLMRVIMTSRSYQLSSRPHPENATDTRFYTHYNVKRLPAEVLLDGIDFACRTQEKYAGIPAGTRAIELPDPNYSSYFLDTLGRPKRVITCECERTTQPNLAQVLHIANGEVLSGKVADKNGRVAKLVTARLPAESIISELYLVTLSRPPREPELARCRKIISAGPSRREAVEDILWALCNSREFLFNH